MAVGLLLSAFAKSYSKEELYLQQKFKERLADMHATVGKPSVCTSFTDICEWLKSKCNKVNDQLGLISGAIKTDA